MQHVCKILWHLSWVDHRNYSEDNSDNETTSKITLTMTMPTPPYSNSMMTAYNWWWWWWQKLKFRDRLNSSPGWFPCTHHPIFSQADQRWTGTRALSLSLLQNMLVFCLWTRHGPVTPCPELRPYVGDDRSGVLTLEWRYGPTVVIPLDTTDIRPSLLYTNITFLTKRWPGGDL